MNVSLLCKWWWKLDNENGLWQEIVKAKYFKMGSCSAQLSLGWMTPVWSDLLKVRHIYLQGRVLKTRNGEHTLFWQDP